MSASNTQAFPHNAVVSFLDDEYPNWETGASVLRDADGKVCGSFWFKRSADGGVELVVSPDKSCGGVVKPADETRF